MQKYIFYKYVFCPHRNVSVCFSTPTNVCAKKVLLAVGPLWCHRGHWHSTRCPFEPLSPHVPANNEKQWAVNRAEYRLMSLSWYIFLNDSPHANRFTDTNIDLKSCALWTFQSLLQRWLCDCDVRSLLQGKGPGSPSMLLDIIWWKMSERFLLDI